MSTRLIVLAAVGLALATAGPAAAAPEPGGTGASGLVPAETGVDAGPSLYIIELRGEPAATYQGGLKGLSATSPLVTGATQLDSDAAETVAYVDFLRQGQQTFVRQLARSLGRPVKVMHDYAFVLNGVAVELSAAEAEVVGGMPQVTAIEKSRTLQLDTDAGPKWIGAPGVWDGSAVPGGVGTMGEGVIVGVIDTGINTDHPSFAAVGGDGYVHENPFGEGNYKGWCDPEHPNHDPVLYACNSKLVGMWSFESSGNDAEDDDGHGSHTAGTAAGNFITASLIAPTIVVTTPLQGVAPHANIIAYDVCTAGGGCALAAIADAIDQAVDDGVHVTNYSIGGGGDNDEPWSESHVFEPAWRRLRAAGIWAATSAGNAGPNPATTAKVSPWYTGVGASTHNRSVENALIDMTGGELPAPADMTGKSLSGGYGPARIVYALGRLHEDGTPDDGQCNTPFPPGTFTDVEIVACDRGIIARVAKGQNVLAGGAGGMVLMNTAAEGNALVGDAHFLPAVHISYNDGVALKEWLGSGTGHMATIAGTRFSLDPGNGDIMASFSSRGWSVMNTCCIRDYPTADVLGTRWVNLLKPDVTAPGVDIWAPDNTDSEDPAPVAEYQLLSGTSMSGPHVAGSFALLRGLHPEWTPAQGQSALMLTSVTEGVRKQDGVTPADPFDMGAGRINVSNAANAGFVVNPTLDEMMEENPSTGGEPSTINVASMADFRCIGTCSWTRTVTSVWDDPVDWTLSTEAGAGMTLAVSPQSFTLAPGADQEITVVANVSGVMTDTYAFGSVHFDPGAAGPALAHMPVAVRAPAYALPYTVVQETPAVYTVARGAANGNWTIDGIRSKALDDVSVEGMGLVVPEVATAEVGQDNNTTPYDAITGTAIILIDVPENTLRVVAEMRGGPAQVANLYLGVDLNGDGLAQQTEARCASGLGQSRAFCALLNPAAGQWWIMLHNVAASAPGAVDMLTVYSGSVVPGESNLTATAPASVDGTSPWALDLDWDVPEAAPGDIVYGAVAVNAGDDPLFTMHLDLNVTEAPPSVYLPDLSNKSIR